ncbi:MAG: FAD:protein transferase [Clostridiales bacterium]|nr:FAD:protein transferase [Clostridiales bacterium]
MKKVMAVVLIAVLLINLNACTSKKETRYEASFLELFDTVTTIVGYAKDEAEFKEKTQMIYDQLMEYHKLYDIYHDYEGINNIKTINDNAGKEPVKVDQKIINLLLFSKSVYEKTEGNTNVAFGAVLSIWHAYRTAGIDDPEHAKLPPMEELKEAAKHTSIEDVIIDEAASTVYLKDAKMSLDVGAIAKGYATEMVSRYAISQGFTNGMLSVGGNVRTIGHKLSGEGEEIPWSVGIQNPGLDDKDEALFVLNLEGYSLVTSGVYERYYTVEGKKYHHIINTHTLMPQNNYLSVSIISKDSGLADGLSTAIFDLSLVEGQKLIESMPDTEALWVLSDGEMAYSDGFMALVKKSN